MLLAAWRSRAARGAALRCGHGALGLGGQRPLGLLGVRLANGLDDLPEYRLKAQGAPTLFALPKSDEIVIDNNPNSLVTLAELEKNYRNRIAHDPRDLDRARSLATPGERVRLGVFYRNETRARYDLIRRVAPKTVAERVALLNTELDNHAV